MKNMDQKIHSYRDNFDVPNILIVDDNIECLQILNTCFKMAGYKTVCATRGDEAFSLLRTSTFTLMITDYNLPEMNGLILSKKAKAISPNLAIIMITGQDRSQLKQIAYESGIIHILQKPLNIKGLISVVSSTINDGFSSIKTESSHHYTR